MKDPVPPTPVVYQSTPMPVAESGAAVSPAQYTKAGVATGAAGVAFTVTDTGVRGPSQPLTVCDTYHVMVPGIVVMGVGVAEVPVPPVALVYHRRPVPLAESGAERES